MSAFPQRNTRRTQTRAPKFCSKARLTRFVETDDGFVLIDYKTDRKTAEELKARYSRQLGYYAYAVERLFGKPVKKAYIRSFSLDETIEIPLH